MYHSAGRPPATFIIIIPQTVTYLWKIFWKSSHFNVYIRPEACQCVFRCWINFSSGDTDCSGWQAGKQQNIKKAAWISIMGFTTTELLCLVIGVEMLFIVFKTCVLPALITFFNYCHYLLALFIFTTCGAGQRRHHHHHHHCTIHRTVNLLEIFQCRKGKLKLAKFNFMEH